MNFIQQTAFFSPRKQNLLEQSPSYLLSFYCYLNMEAKYRAILGVGPSATKSEIRSAYLSKCLQTHPDKLIKTPLQHQQSHKETTTTSSIHHGTTTGDTFTNDTLFKQVQEAYAYFADWINSSSSSNEKDFKPRTKFIIIEAEELIKKEYALICSRFTRKEFTKSFTIWDYYDYYNKKFDREHSMIKILQHKHSIESLLGLSPDSLVLGSPLSLCDGISCRLSLRDESTEMTPPPSPSSTMMMMMSETFPLHQVVTRTIFPKGDESRLICCTKHMELHVCDSDCFDPEILCPLYAQCLADQWFLEHIPSKQIHPHQRKSDPTTMALCHHSTTLSSRSSLCSRECCEPTLGDSSRGFVSIDGFDLVYICRLHPRNVHICNDWQCSWVICSDLHEEEFVCWGTGRTHPIHPIDTSGVSSESTPSNSDEDHAMDTIEMEDYGDSDSGEENEYSSVDSIEDLIDTGDDDTFY